MPVLRARRESQELEYKSEFPSNTRDLGKEIAAFASSNTGTILIGVDDAGELIGLMDRYFAGSPLAESTLDQVRELIRTTVLKLDDLCERSSVMLNSGRIEELQSQASELARPLARVCWYNINPLGKGIKSELKNVARTLHLTETMQIYMDGGASIQAVVDRVRISADKLRKLSERSKAYYGLVPDSA